MAELRNYFKNSNINFLVPHIVLTDPKFVKMTVSAKYLYVCLCKVANNQADDDGWFWHGIDQLIALTGIKRQTIINAKRELKDNEFIDVKRSYLEHSLKRKYDYFRLNGYVFRSKK